MSKKKGPKKLDGRRILAREIEELFAALRGEFDSESLVPKLAEKIAANDILRASLSHDAARLFIQDEIRARKKITIQPQIYLWTFDDLNEGVIPLERGMNVKYRDANYEHWQTKLEHQLKALEKLTGAIDHTKEWIEVIDPMRVIPTMTTIEFMTSNGWSRNVA